MSRWKHCSAICLLIESALLILISLSSVALGSQTTNIDRLIEQLKTQNTNQQSATIEAIVEKGENSVPSLRRAMKHPDWRVRRGAAIAIGKLGTQAKSAIPELTIALQDKTYEVISAAIDALGSMGEAAAPAVPFLIKHLTAPRYSDSKLTLQIESTLVGIGRPAVPSLIELLDSRFDNVWFPAALALRRIGKPAVPRLVQALRSSKWIIRYRAASALMMGEPAREAVPVLIERLTSQQNRERHELVRSQIIETLGVNQIEAQTVVPVLIELLPHPEAVSALGQFGNEASSAVPYLVKLLRDRTNDSRIEATKALLKIGQASQLAIPDLKYALSDPNYIVRCEAATTIVGLGATSEFDLAVAAVVELLEAAEEHIRLGAIETLRSIGAVSIKQSVSGLAHTIQNAQEVDVKRHATSALIKIAYTLKENQKQGTASNADIQITVQGLQSAEQVWQQEQQKFSSLDQQSLSESDRYWLPLRQGIINLLLQYIKTALQCLENDRNCL